MAHSKTAFGSLKGEPCSFNSTEDPTEVYDVQSHVVGEYNAVTDILSTQSFRISSSPFWHICIAPANSDCITVNSHTHILGQSRPESFQLIVLA